MRKAFVLLVAILVVGLGFVLAAQYVKDMRSPAADETGAVRDAVIGFGATLKMVSLLAPAQEVAAAMDANYTQYVSPELLQQWKNGTDSRLGRLASSPSPDRIEVTDVARQQDGTYKVAGNIIEVTSADDPLHGVAAVQPVTFILEKIQGRWLIVSSEKGSYSEIPHQETIEGVWECAPHKQGAAHTEECMAGIAKDQSDGHVALDLSVYESGVGAFSAGDHVRVTGVLVPADQLSSNAWQAYDIDGIMQVVSLEKI